MKKKISENKLWNVFIFHFLELILEYIEHLDKREIQKVYQKLIWVLFFSFTELKAYFLPSILQAEILIF